MTRRDPLISMREMRDHAREAMEIRDGRSQVELEQDRLFRYALIHLLEIIGEAARRVPESSRRRYKTVDWPNLIELRHRLAHGYDAVNLELVWSVTTDELPSLIQQLDAILGTEETQ